MRRIPEDIQRAGPLAPAIIDTLFLDDLQSGSELARTLRVRKATVLDTCRRLAATGRIERVGRRWRLPLPTACEAHNRTGLRCGRAAAPGNVYCTLHADTEPRWTYGPWTMARAKAAVISRECLEGAEVHKLFPTEPLKYVRVATFTWANRTFRIGEQGLLHGREARQWLAFHDPLWLADYDRRPRPMSASR